MTSSVNFSGISNQSSLGKLLRLPLKLIPRELQIPILQGKLKGKKWIVGSSQHGCWLGSYEYDKQLLFEQTITPGSTVYDLGGHVGFYTLLASVLVGNTGKVISFEPLPDNLKYLKKHLQINNISNTQIVEAAVCERNGIAYFETHNSSFQGHLGSNGTLQVKTVSLDELITKEKLPIPNYLKIDVEGAEVQVLQGAKQILTEFHPTIFLATHGDKLQKECCQFITDLGYQLRAISEKDLADSDEIMATYQK
ncbi:MAG: FkbM family methyltransferase [Xenococcaceae cyanobacterium MO_167.B27]|nr:FkbM family methyltransferase [Xenococcaceae cyanobacterium MO_167.B27]